jgi:sulfotransferase
MYFISGLPRSGSTLLVAILRQNPKVYANISSPLSEIFVACDASMAANKEGHGFISDRQRDEILKGVFDNYYKSCNKEIIFDNSRLWNSKLTLLLHLFPEAKFICCVREIGWIVDSFERLYRKNNQQPSALYGWTSGGTVFSRTEHLLKPDNILGFSYNATLEALTSGHGDRILLLDYENLCLSPELVMEQLYNFLEEEQFEHKFDNLKFEAKQFDKNLGAPGLHSINGPVRWEPRQTIIPLNLFNEAQAKNFWRVNTNL